MSAPPTVEIDPEDLEVDPDPILARLRAEAPVCFVPALDMWLVTRWADVEWMDEHPEVFSAATEPSFLRRALGENMLTLDPPQHTRLRAALLPPFLPGGRSGAYASAELAEVCDALLDDMAAAGGPAELMAAYAEPVATISLARVLGLDTMTWTELWDACAGVCADIANFTNDPEATARGDAARARLGEAIGAAIDSSAGTGSAIEHFVGAGLSTEEIVNNIRLMVSGGINEPRDGIGLVTWVLLTRPDLRQALEADPGRWRRLVEEVFRVHSPVGTITRQATGDVELGGTAIPGGALVAGVLRSANLDEARWSRPGEIDLERREGGHAAFALGAHRCLGEWLGRQQVRVGVQRLLERFGDLRLVDPDAVALRGFEFRGPPTLDVAWG